MTLREWLQEEPFTLTLSSGFFGFFAHAGLISVLAEESLIPSKITGCSAGALTGSLWAAGLQPDQMMAFFQSVEKSDFWDPGLGLGVLKGQKFRNLLTEKSPVQKVEDCSIPMAISVFDIKRFKNRVFHSGPLSELVYASCAIPPLFQPIRIEGQWYWDGAFTDRGGLAGAEDHSRVLYHHLGSRSARKNKKDLIQSHRERVELVEIEIAGVPSVNPNNLTSGPLAYQTVRDGFLKRMDQPKEF